MQETIGGNKLGGLLLPKSNPSTASLRVKLHSEAPRQVDMRPYCTPVENQGKVGSCAANAMVGALEYHLKRNGTPVDLSRLFVYWNARAIRDRTNEDAGALMHHVMAAVMAHGCCTEEEWPYVQTMYLTRPPEECYSAARKFMGVEFARVDFDSTNLIGVLANEIPTVMAVWFPDSIYREAMQNKGIVSRETNHQGFGGGHAMLIVGYDLDSQYFIVRNSWGDGFFDGGYMYIPFEFCERWGADVCKQIGLQSQTWVCGALSNRPGFDLHGASQGHPVTYQEEQGKEEEVINPLDVFRQNISNEFENRLSNARSGIRDRLRGPGAGGGY